MQSLRNKIDDLELCISSKLLDYDAICLTEHHMCHDEVKLLNFSNYLVASSFCRMEKSRGGSLILLKKSLKFKELYHIVKKSSELDCELAAVELIDHELILITIYRSPQGSLDEFFKILNETISKYKLMSKKTIIMGDFNIHFNINEPETRKMTHFTDSFGFKVLIKENTRGKNCIDNILINFNNLDYETNVIDTYFADHKAISISLNIAKKSMKILRVSADQSQKKDYINSIQ